jgi:DNA (cytosine-5)-methyltransferase 1
VIATVYTVTSIFSGAGGLDFPFIMLGFDIRFAIDIDPGACETYRANVGDIICDDIRTHPIPTEHTDVLIGGFPCPSFSTCGYGRGFDDDRGQLFFSVPTYLSSVKPKVFILENVDNILTKDAGKISYYIVRALSNIGYIVSTTIVHCEYHGVSQRRHRALFIGTRSDVTPLFSYTPVNNRSLTPSWYWLDPVDDNFVPEFACDKRTLAWLAQEKRPNIPYNVKYPRNKYRIDPNGICGTLTTDIGHSMGLFHYKHDRKLTIEEYSRLQGFPPGYRWMGHQSSVGIQIGNAFPPLVMFNIARAVKKWLSTAIITPGMQRESTIRTVAKL